MRDRGTILRFDFADLLRYHGPAFPGGVAHGFTALERALPLLAPDGVPERREVRLRTAFPGPGARDAVELVTRAVTEDRFTVDPGARAPGARADRPAARPTTSTGRDRRPWTGSTRFRAGRVHER